MSYEENHYECYPSLPETNLTTAIIKKVIAEEANKLLPGICDEELYKEFVETHSGPLDTKKWKRQFKKLVKNSDVTDDCDGIFHRDYEAVPNNVVVTPSIWNKVFSGYEFCTVYTVDNEYPTVTENCIVRYFIHDELESMLDNFVITDETDTKILVILWHVD